MLSQWVPSKCGMEEQFRHAIEHMDEKILSDDGPADSVKTILIGDDGIELRGIRVAFRELASWIRQLDDAAEVCAQYRRP